MNIDNLFGLEDDLLSYFNISKDELAGKLEKGQESLVDVWQTCSASTGKNLRNYYEKAVSDEYIFDLANWHLTSTGGYVKDTCRLANDFATGITLDFGGGIGSHSLTLAANRNVKRVDYLDINPSNKDFFKWRVKKSNLSNKIRIISADDIVESSYDFLIALDVLEHLENPLAGLANIHRWLKPSGLSLMNFYFYKGDDNEFPFHLDDEGIVADFMESLSKNFVEVFHKYLITARLYRTSHRLDEKCTSHRLDEKCIGDVE